MYHSNTGDTFTRGYLLYFYDCCSGFRFAQAVTVLRHIL